MNRKFHLAITETIANENYDAEVAEADKRRGLYYDGLRMTELGYWPSRDKTIKVLEVTVTETEFYAIKKAAMETMA